jgi:hypothetical protein
MICRLLLTSVLARSTVVRIDNLLNQRAEWWMGYPIQGIRVNFGLLYKF